MNRKFVAEHSYRLTNQRWLLMYLVCTILCFDDDTVRPCRTNGVLELWLEASGSKRGFR